ncbi:MAG TPA: hypothetical protein VEF89_29555 [Solirubrobacteraceae bacterium]|nr:hypothetical protein [Solirubrobacteraceae bacterium]
MLERGYGRVNQQTVKGVIGYGQYDFSRLNDEEFMSLHNTVKLISAPSIQ